MPGAVRASGGKDTGWSWLSAPTWNEYALKRVKEMLLKFKQSFNHLNLTASPLWNG
jgi:hypothetical protein